MSKRKVILSCFVLLILLVGVLLASCGSSNGSATAAPGGQATKVDGQALMQTRCTVCHSTSRITSAHKTADLWKATVESMITRGAKLSAQEETILVDFLAQNFK